jgi:hypothetical protein
VLGRHAARRAGRLLRRDAESRGYGTRTAHCERDRGTMGVDRTAPVGITGIRLQFQVKFGAKDDGSEVSEAELEKLGKLTERYCVVLQTLVNKPEIRVTTLGS